MNSVPQTAETTTFAFYSVLYAVFEPTLTLLTIPGSGDGLPTTQVKQHSKTAKQGESEYKYKYK